MPVIDLGSVVGPQGPQGATGATGAQGIQGNPGPNQVTDQTSTNLNGVLFGSQSRVTVKPVDSTPTADSTNLVSSGGTDKAIKARMPVYGMGKNLLDNWHFGNPVNQRGQSSYGSVGYTIDRWRIENSTPSLNVVSNGVTFSAINVGGQFLQKIESYKLIDGETYTLSALCTLISGNATIKLAGVDSPYPDFGVATVATGLSSVTFTLNRGSYSGPIKAFIRNDSANGSVIVHDFKLELGTEQTLCHNEGTAEAPVWVLNEVPDYEYELYRCVTSTADSSDTYANKSLVTSDEIGIVVDGNASASGASIGQYVVLQHSTISGKSDGIYKAAKTIPANTEIDGTYLTSVSAGGLNDLKSKADSSGYITFATGGKYSIAGDVVTVYLDSVSPSTTLTGIGTLPVEARPSISMRFPGICDAYGKKSMTVRINSDGAVAIQADGSYSLGYAVCTFVR